MKIYEGKIKYYFIFLLLFMVFYQSFQTYSLYIFNYVIELISNNSFNGQYILLIIALTYRLPFDFIMVIYNKISYKLINLLMDKFRYQVTVAAFKSKKHFGSNEFVSQANEVENLINNVKSIVSISISLVIFFAVVFLFNFYLLFYLQL